MIKIKVCQFIIWSSKFRNGIKIPFRNVWPLSIVESIETYFTCSIWTKILISLMSRDFFKYLQKCFQFFTQYDHTLAFATFHCNSQLVGLQKSSDNKNLQLFQNLLASLIHSSLGISRIFELNCLSEVNAHFRILFSKLAKKIIQFR